MEKIKIGPVTRKKLCMNAENQDTCNFIENILKIKHDQKDDREKNE